MSRAGVRERPFFILGPLFAVVTQIWLHVDDSTAVTVLVIVLGILAAGSLVAGLVQRTASQRSIIYTLALIYFAFTLSHAVPLADLEDGERWLLLAILGTFSVDTGAYFTGRLIGRHRLAPAISPKKTWEGVFGGLAASIGAVIGLVALLDLPVVVWQSVLIGLAITVVGVAGDLFESWLKRRAGVKDSGKIIPGHGGILDRIDSLAPNLAVVYWATQLLEI